jgi:hypothetical protein
MNKGKKELLLISVVLIICLPILWILGKCERNQDNLINREGIETAGTIIEKSFGADETGRTFHLKFDFRVGDTLYVGYQALNNNQHYYDKAIIGMKYKVKYLPDNPGKFKNSRIYIDKPILQEFDNIENEKERILKNYGSK